MTTRLVTMSSTMHRHLAMTDIIDRLSTGQRNALDRPQPGRCPLMDAIFGSPGDKRETRIQDSESYSNAKGLPPPR